MERDAYKIGDYVKYLGYGMSGIDSETAKVIQLRKHEDYWWVGVELLASKEKISFDVSKLRIIPLEEKHLFSLGFQKYPSENDFRCYKLNDIYISSISIQLSQIKFLFISGFCLMNRDLFSKIAVNDLVENGEFNIQKFYELYPSLYNLNDLIEILTDRNMITAEEVEKLVLL
ncbi:hypothetical protein [Flavobacterium sp.]|uniref:hypothetical protein n=1 Tax=Flavobacterium sp. TaxID=239 RepID=UPI002FDA3665